MSQRICHIGGSAAYTWPGGLGRLSKKVRMLWPARGTVHFFTLTFFCAFRFSAQGMERPWRRRVRPQAACTACASTSQAAFACAAQLMPLLSAQAGCCKAAIPGSTLCPQKQRVCAYYSFKLEGYTPTPRPGRPVEDDVQSMNAFVDSVTLSVSCEYDRVANNQAAWCAWLSLSLCMIGPDQRPTLRSAVRLLQAPLAHQFQPVQS